MSQSRCGWSSSQTSYASSAWWAVTRTNYLIRNRLRPDRFPFETQQMPIGYIIWYYPAFRPAIPESGVH